MEINFSLRILHFSFAVICKFLPHFPPSRHASPQTQSLELPFPSLILIPRSSAKTVTCLHPHPPILIIQVPLSYKTTYFPEAILVWSFTCHHGFVPLEFYLVIPIYSPFLIMWLIFTLDKYLVFTKNFTSPSGKILFSALLSLWSLCSFW